MTLAQHQRQLIEDFGLIEDRQERLAAIVDLARQRPPLPAEHRIEGNLVKGCISQVWLACESDNGLCTFQCDADSPLVKGLVALFCELYSGHPAAEIAAEEPVILQELGIAANLTPTRLNGLTAVRSRIRDFATSVLQR